jgi:hypothetical protein
MKLQLLTLKKDPFITNLEMSIRRQVDDVDGSHCVDTYVCWHFLWLHHTPLGAGASERVDYLTGAPPSFPPRQFNWFVSPGDDR